MLFAVMVRIILILMGMAFILGSCNDSFNDPNPDYEEIIDLTAPSIELISLAADSIYHGIDTLDLRVRYVDDYLLDNIKFDMVPLNISAASLNLNYKSTDSVFMMDTFYSLPVADTIEFGILTICTDYAGNVNSESFNIKVVK